MKKTSDYGKKIKYRHDEYNDLQKVIVRQICINKCSKSPMAYTVKYVSSFSVKKT